MKKYEKTYLEEWTEDFLMKLSEAADECQAKGPRHERWFISPIDDLNDRNPSGCWSEEDALRVCEEWNSKDLLDAKREGRPAHHYVVQRLNEDGTYEVVK